jgi:translation initiation factor 3 subunit L
MSQVHQRQPTRRRRANQRGTGIHAIALAPFNDAYFLEQVAFRQQLHVLMSDVKQQLTFQSLRAYMRLYSSIDLNKLARTHFTETHTLTILSKLLSFKHKMHQLHREEQPGSHIPANVRRLATDVHYYIDDTTLHVDDASTHAHTMESAFISAIHKHAEIVQSVQRAYEECIVQHP